MGLLLNGGTENNSCAQMEPLTCCSDISLFVHLNSLFVDFQFPVISEQESPSNHLKYRGLPRQKNGRIGTKMAQIPCFSLLFMVTSRDRIAANYLIRHPVRPIVALQRRMRFSARLAGFCRGRWHQRRARRAELASFSILVSNLDFRVPRLRQRGKWAAGRAVRPPKRGHPRDPESRPGLPWRSGLARSGPGVPGLH